MIPFWQELRRNSSPNASRDYQCMKFIVVVSLFWGVVEYSGEHNRTVHSENFGPSRTCTWILGWSPLFQAAVRSQTR
jgi:hypothetical protein